MGIQREIPAPPRSKCGTWETTQRISSSRSMQTRISRESQRTFQACCHAGVTPCTTPAIPSALGRVNCNEGVIRQRTNSAYSDYHGVEMELRTQNLWRQLTMRANYTYSKATDNADEIFGTFGTGSAIAFSQNPLDFTGAEHGLSGLDFPHQFNLLITEDLPFFRGQHGYRRSCARRLGRVGRLPLGFRPDLHPSSNLSGAGFSSPDINLLDPNPLVDSHFQCRICGIWHSRWRDPSFHRQLVRAGNSGRYFCGRRLQQL